MRPIPAGRLVGASIVALLALPAAAHAAVVDVTPATPVAGAPLTLAGRGFPHGAAGTVRLSAAGGAQLRADAAGRIAAVLTVPDSLPPGRRALIVDVGGRRLRTPVTVLGIPRPVSSTLTVTSGGRRAVVSPADLAPGAALLVRGSGFRARTHVSARIGGRVIGRARADRRGRFALRTTMPRLAPGEKTLRLAARGVRLRLRLRVVAPAAPPAPAPAPAPAAPPPAAPATPTPAPAPPGAPVPPPVPPGQPVLVGAAGDIACDPTDPDFNGGAGIPGACQQRATSSLLLSLQPAAVLGLGDMQYNAGDLGAFEAVYRVTWGRVDGIMFPVPGNHEYGRPAASGFFSYFGARAGPPGRGYYSFDLGSWHVIALNSNCEQVSCATGSPQELWLRADLAAHPGGCTLAFFHHPLFSSGQGEGDEPVRPFWDDLYAAGADLVLNGHSHNYERFAAQTPAGAADAARGIREIVVGTGGEDLQPFLPTIAPHSQRRSDDAFGVLALTLEPGGYDWRFRAIAGSAFTDSGSGTCH